jgi:hypothetical protein
MKKQKVSPFRKRWGKERRKKMTKEERRIRMQVALEILDNVYTDICHDNETTREETREFCDFIIETRMFLNNFNKKMEKK